MSASPESAPASRRLVAVWLLVPLLAAFALWAFAWPASRLAPRDLPIGVAGPAAATATVDQRLAAHPGAFEIHHYTDAAAARHAVEDREVYGALVATPGGPELLTASAAGPTVAQLLRTAAESAAPPGTTVHVTDVVPAPATDPRGAVFGAGLLPLVLAGVATGAVVTVLRLRGGRAIAALAGAALLTGLVGAGVAHSWLGALTGGWWAEAGVIGLTVLAVGATSAGTAALLGTAGLGVAGLLMVLIGNAFSGVSSAPELLPAPAGVLGQQLPPGAAGTLLRSVSYFDGAGAAGPLLTLSLWAGLGLAAVGLTAARRTRPTGQRDQGRVELRSAGPAAEPVRANP
ncbi:MULTISPECIES: ABC transporter permease [Kitasatospora]|uniref:ABC transporter permease n=1 Tax=Kitasatospora arboriphila TaxID=258052 RepID=A0ABP4E563_9ACTN